MFTGLKWIGKGKIVGDIRRQGPIRSSFPLPEKVALIRDVERDLNLAEIRDKLIQDVDLILSEGYKKDVQPKIEIFRKEKHQELLCTKEDNLDCYRLGPKPSMSVFPVLTLRI